MNDPDARPRSLSERPLHERLTSFSTLTILAITTAVVALVYLLSLILVPFVVAGLIAFICTPLVDWLKARTKLPRWIPAVVVFLVLTFVAVVVGNLGLPPLLQEIKTVVTNFHTIVQGLARMAIGDQTVMIFGEPMTANTIASGIMTVLRNWFGQSGRILVLSTWSFGAVFSAFLTWVLLIYFLISGHQISRGLFWVVPPRQRPVAHEIWAALEPVLKRYFIGVAIVVTYASVAAYIGLGIALQLKHAVVLAILTGFLEMIPVIGPGASAVIAGLVAVQEAKSLWNIMAYVIYATALRLSIDDLLGPVVLGRAASLHPVLIMFCFLAGGILFGITGVILAVPTALSIKVILATLYEEPLE